MLTSDDLAVRVSPDVGADRWLICGKTGCGKSTLANFQINRFYDDYVRPLKPGGPPRGRILILDTKPRFRAQYTADGIDAKKMYKDWEYGQPVPNSRAVTNTREWNLAWQTGAGIVILQNAKAKQQDLIKWELDMLEKFWRSQRRGMPSFVVVDESLDWFGPSGTYRHGDTINRICRAGREKGCAIAILAQRPKTISLLTVTEANCLALFQLAYRGDVVRLWEMGIPPDFTPPIKKYDFGLFRDEEIVTKRARLAL